MEKGAVTTTFGNLVAAINEGTMSDVDHWLHFCDQKQTKITKSKVNGGQFTVLGHIIVSKSDSEVLKLLFSRADFNVNFVEKSFGEDIPLLHLAAYVGNLEAVTLLCNSQDINLDATLYRTHLTALHMSVKGGNPNIVRQVLHKARLYQHLDNPHWFSSFLNRKDFLGMTALHYAAWEGHEDIVTQLLDYPIDVNPNQYEGITPLHLASWNDHLGVVHKLLAHRHIDPQVPCNKLLLIMGDLKVKDRWRTGMQQTLHDLENFLPHCDQRYRHTLVGYFPGPVHTFRLQLEDKVAANTLPFTFPDLHNNVTALHCAAFAGHSQIVGALVGAISTGAQAWKTLNFVDDHLMTPLHYAIIRGDASTVGTLASNSMVQGNHEEIYRNLTPLDMVSVLSDYAKDPSLVQEYKCISFLLLGRQDVQKYLDDVYNEKQMFLNAVNAIMIVASVIASIGAQAWSTYDSLSRSFYFNAFSCYFATFTLLIGGMAVLPSQGKTGKAEVRRLSTLLLCMSLMFSASVISLVVSITTSHYRALIFFSVLGVLIILYNIYLHLHMYAKDKHRTWKRSTKINPFNFPTNDSNSFS